MRALPLILFLVCNGWLSAQQTDTTYFKNEYEYMVYDKAKWQKGDGPVSYYDENGVLKKTLLYKKKKLEVARYYYDNGQLWSELPYRKGKLDGVIRSYYRNGNVEWTKPWRKGKLFGERMLLDSTGAPANGDNVQLLPYDDVKVTSHCVNGRPEGKVVVTRKDKLVYVGNYTNGAPDGYYIYYNDQGVSVRKELYRKGRFVKSEWLN